MPPTPPDCRTPAVVLAGLDLLPAGIGVFEADGRLAYCNRAFRHLRDLPEALCRAGTPLEEIVRYIARRGDYGPGDAEAEAARRMEEIGRGRAWDAEQEIPGGRRLLISHTPLPDRGLMITYADVTEARATERKLRDDEQRYALITQAVAEGIYDWNVEDGTLYVSPRLMEIFGLDGRLTSEHWFALVHREDREPYRSAIRDCFRGAASQVECEYRILVRSGEYRWVEDHGLPVRDAAGRAVRLVGAVSDVTARKETERALRESEERHALAMEAINESVYEWDLVDGRMYYSPRLRTALGLTAEELRTADDWLRRIHPEDLAAYKGATRALLKAETERLEIEYRYRHPDGTWRWARQHGLAQRDASGRAIRVTGSTGDITAEKRMEGELERAQAQLIVKAKLASLGEVTAGIAHEIKNPLNFVNNFAELSVELADELDAALAAGGVPGALRDEVAELTGTMRANLAKIVEHGRRADSIVRSMLLHAREGAGELRLVEVNALVEEALGLAYHGARAESAEFNVTLESELDPAAGVAELYAQEVVRVLLNLLSNAFYAALERKRGAAVAFEPVVRLATKGFPERVEIRVRDNGSGIPDDVKERIFTPFFTTKPAGEGTGLGLSLSYDIVVKQHGGAIEVASAPGEFTEFVVTLPRGKAGASSSP